LLAACEGIHEACGFEELAEQRTRKVVNARYAIEQKILKILASFGPRSPNPANRTKPCGEGLLNDPQLPDSAMQQTEIDRLLASFA
jgi:chemotaxis regulatin CheY-phosphate phosphatase CheZ